MCYYQTCHADEHDIQEQHTVQINYKYQLTNLTPCKPIDLSRSTVEYLNGRRPVKAQIRQLLDNETVAGIVHKHMDRNISFRTRMYKMQ